MSNVCFFTVIVACSSMLFPQILVDAFIDEVYSNVIRKYESETIMQVRDDPALKSLAHHYYCGVYVQYDGVLEQFARKRHKLNKLASIVKHMITTATIVFRRTKTTYMRRMHFYLKQLVRVNATNITITDFVRSRGGPEAVNHCLAVHITLPEPGISGLARVNGICSQYLMHGSWRASNVFAISVDEYFNQWVLDLTFIHELGHVFGAYHDGITANILGDTLCPLSWQLETNYIMYPDLRITFHKNQRLFSPCSIKTIEDKLRSVFESNIHLKCFETFKEGVCGNEIVEEGEQCDCGLTKESCAGDKCCFSDFHDEDKTSEACHFVQMRPKANCSISNGECCNEDTCDFHEKGRVCEPISECFEPSLCTGSSASCPDPVPKPDGTRCGHASCRRGECKGSLCLSYGFEPCTPSQKNISSLCLTYCWNWSGKLCEPLCKLNTSVSCSEVLPPGSECFDGRGFCDFVGTCRNKQRPALIFRGAALLIIAILLLTYILVILVIAPYVPRGNVIKSKKFKLFRDAIIQFTERVIEPYERKKSRRKRNVKLIEEFQAEVEKIKNKEKLKIESKEMENCEEKHSQSTEEQRADQTKNASCSLKTINYGTNVEANELPTSGTNINSNVKNTST